MLSGFFPPNETITCLFLLYKNFLLFSEIYILVVCDVFQGELEVVKESHGRSIIEKQENADVLINGNGGDTGFEVQTESTRMPFLMLGLDLPPPPLFKDVMEKNIIPQVILIL